jgi:hypothetical protein
MCIPGPQRQNLSLIQLDPGPQPCSVADPDPVFFLPLDPRSGSGIQEGKNPNSGSEMKIRIIVPRAKSFFPFFLDVLLARTKFANRIIRYQLTLTDYAFHARILSFVLTTSCSFATGTVVLPDIFWLFHSYAEFYLESITQNFITLSSRWEVHNLFRPLDPPLRQNFYSYLPVGILRWFLNKHYRYVLEQRWCFSL